MCVDFVKFYIIFVGECVVVKRYFLVSTGAWVRICPQTNLFSVFLCLDIWSMKASYPRYVNYREVCPNPPQKVLGAY